MAYTSSPIHSYHRMRLVYQLLLSFLILLVTGCSNPPLPNHITATPTAFSQHGYHLSSHCGS